MEEVNDELPLIGASIPSSEVGQKLEIGKKMTGFKRVQEEFLKSVNFGQCTIGFKLNLFLFITIRSHHD